MLQLVPRESESTARPGVEALALLAAGTAHELNNPLSVIVGYLSLILSGKTPPDRLREQLLKVQTEAQHCRLVLDGLTQLAESTVGDKTTLDVAELLRDAATELNETRPKLRVEVDVEEPLACCAFEAGLAQLFRHLLRNAGESSARSLRLSASSSGGWLRIEVADDGGGLSAAQLARAKEPFFSTKPGSLGLGLAICELVVSAHAGSLSLSSTLGQGTNAIVLLPAAVEARK